MEGAKFFDTVAAHPELEVAGVLDEKILVKHEKTRALYTLTPDAVESAEWETLQAILCGNESAKVLCHMTRIVGYYSQIENWNKSKLGELIDRRRGDYIVRPAAGAGAMAAAG